MAAIGSAVGLGNLVRFPREMASQGGAAFLIVYLGLLLLIGLPAILGEMSIGKLANQSPIHAFRKLAGEGAKGWMLLGVFGMLAAVFVLFFYTVIAGWALRFFFESFRDGWWDDPIGLFQHVETGPWAIFWNAVVVGVTVWIVGRGVSGGIEKAAIIMMPTLFAIVIGIAIFAGIKDAASGFEGMKEVWKPQFGELGVNNVSKATGQVFFSLSLGQGAMLTYASYMDKKQSVAADGTTIAFADTGVALLGAMMVFPILGFTGLLADPETQAIMDGGSFATAFIALPNAFTEMGPEIGRIVGALFFLGLFFAALSSAISLLEVPVSILVDNLNLRRPQGALLMGLAVYIPGVLASIDSTWLTLFDEIAINFFIVVGVALTTLFAGWLAPGIREEIDSNVRVKIGRMAIWMMRTVTPLLIVVTFVYGGLFNADNEFWGDGANWQHLVELLKDAFT